MMRADYSAAKTGRFRRRRSGISTTGSSGDYHFRNENDLFKIMEVTRDMERNDAVVEPLVAQFVGNIVQGGLFPEPKTGDTGADAAIKERWWDWASDARQCSHDGEFTYRDIEKLVMRRMAVDGDILGVLTEDGTVQAMEAHRCRNPQRTQQNAVHGVLLDERRRRQQYWFTRDDIDPMSAVRINNTDLEKVDAFSTDEFGEYRQVLHLRNPKRFTLTRGVSAFAPIFDFMGMHEDLHFSKLVQQQVASCIAFIRELSPDSLAGGVKGTDPYGPQTYLSAAKRLIDQLAPGMEITTRPGEKVTGFSPNIPNAEFFQQMRTILQLIGANLGIPLVLLLLDASDTNFSGWRGAMDSARMGFKDMQQTLIDHWDCPVYLWKVRQWAQEDPALRKLMNKQAMDRTAAGKVTRVPALFRHEWNAPRWPYVQPLQDAQADALRQKSLLSSPRRIHGDRSQDYNDVIRETVDDNAFAIEAAATKAKELSTKIGERVTWRELLFMTDVEMLKAATASVGTGPTGAPSQGAGPAPLNGAQITAALDMVGRIRAGTLAPAAAVELLAGMGIDRARAETMVAATKAGEGASEGTVQFLRELLKSYAANPNTLPLLVNATDVGAMLEQTAAPRNKEYLEPYLPVLAPAGTPVSGDVLKDPQGDIVGGATIGSPAPAPPTVPGAMPPPGEEKPGEKPANPKPGEEEEATPAPQPGAPAPAKEEEKKGEPAPAGEDDDDDKDDEEKDNKEDDDAG